MKEGDLVIKVEGEMDYGKSGILVEVYEIFRQERLVIVITDEGIKCWSADSVEVISESR
jgi:hypothetical protein